MASINNNWKKNELNTIMVSKDMKLCNPKKVGSEREPLSTQLWQCILLLTLLGGLVAYNIIIYNKQ